MSIRRVAPVRGFPQSTWVIYMILSLALLIVAAREGIDELPFINVLRVLKYPIGFLAAVLIVPILVNGWQKNSRSQKWFMVLGFLTLVSAILSMMLNPETSILSYLIILIEWVFLSVSIVSVVNDTRQVRFLFLGLLLIGVINVGWGIVANVPMLEEVNFSIQTETGRFGGIGLDANYFAMLATIPLAYALASGSDSKSRFISRVAFSVIAAFIMVAIVWSRSRSGSLSILVILVAVMGLRGFKNSLISGSFILLGFMFFALMIGFDEMSNIYYGLLSRWEVGSQALGRPEIWSAALGNVSDSPIWGWGPGALQSLITLGIYEGIGGFIKPHNAWIIVAIERGMIGLILQIAMVFLGFRSSLRIYRMGGSSERTLGVAALGGLCGQVFMSLTLGGMPLGIYLVSAAMIALDANLSRQWLVIQTEIDLRAKTSMSAASLSQWVRA